MSHSLALVRRVFSPRGDRNDLRTLTNGLPGFVSVTDSADWAENVTPADDLSPISAALGAYQRVIACGQRERGSIMKDVTANFAKTSNRKPRKSSDQQTALQLCYREIGISAVAAAARYQSGAKNPGYSPVVAELDERGAMLM
jgi:hypothetical protein